MTEIKQRALALLNEILVERGFAPKLLQSRKESAVIEAICRTIEAHEADKQAFSDAVEQAFAGTLENAGRVYGVLLREHFARFIITKPDPLVEILMREDWPTESTETVGAKFRAALDARGLEIVEKKS